MTAENFAFWLQGYFELGGENLSPQQVQVIKDHLALVFNKVTPSYDLGATTIPQAQTFGGDYAKAQEVYNSSLKNWETGGYYSGFPPNWYPRPSNK